MAITGAVGAALRQEAPYQAEIAMGAQLIMDFAGLRTGGRPYYWHRGTRYASPEKIPGWSFSRNSVAYGDSSNGIISQVAANVPRITDRGLQLEGARTNLLTYSQQFDNAIWSKNDGPVTVQPNVALAPNGAFAADAIIPTADSNIHRVAQRSISVTAGQSYVLSAVAKANGYRYLYINGDFNIGAAATFDLISGSVANTKSGFAVIIPLFDGWYMCAVIGVAPTTSANAGVFFQVNPTPVAGDAGFVGDGTSGVLLWQADLQPGVGLRSPIITTNAPAIQPADNAFVTGLGGILSGSVTLAASAYLPAADGVARYLAQLSRSPPDNAYRALLSREATGNAAYGYVSSAGALSSMGPSSAKAGARVLKGALRLQATSAQAAFDGVLTGAVSLTAPTGLDRLALGYNDVTGITALDGYLQRIVLGDIDTAQLQRLSA